MADLILSERVLENIKKYRNGREIASYGYISAVNKKFKDLGCEINTIFTGNKDLLNEKDMHCVEYQLMKDKRDSYYIIVPLILEDGGTGQRGILEQYGYTELQDYIFIPDTVTIKKCKGKYQDIKGNTVEGKFDANLSVVLYGSNNHVIVEPNVAFRGRLNVELRGNNNYVKIGANSIFDSANEIFLKNDNNVIEIGKKCIFRGNRIGAFCDSYLKISDGCDFGIGTKFMIHDYSKVYFGADCMISWNVVIQTGDGHSFFDVVTKKNINSGKDLRDKEGILYTLILQDHVWIGRDAMIFAGGSKKVEIGAGSIVGARSFVKNSFPNNCSIAGVPAKIIRRNVAWSRKNFSDNIDDCMGYANLTEDKGS